MKKTLAVLMLLMIAATGIAAGTDYVSSEISSKTVIEGLANSIYDADVDISPMGMRVDYRTDVHSQEILWDDISIVLGVYSYTIDKYPEVGDLMVRLRDPEGKLLGTYRCEREWIENTDLDVEELSDLIFETFLSN